VLLALTEVERLQFRLLCRNLDIALSVASTPFLSPFEIRPGNSSRDHVSSLKIPLQTDSLLLAAFDAYMHACLLTGRLRNTCSRAGLGTTHRSEFCRIVVSFHIRSYASTRGESRYQDPQMSRYKKPLLGLMCVISIAVLGGISRGTKPLVPVRLVHILAS
jgi:hypothetical protein